MRIYSGSAYTTREECPKHVAAKADYAIKRSKRRESPLLADMAFEPLTAVLDLVEHRGYSVEDACAALPSPADGPRILVNDRVRPPHEGLLAWTRHAARAYLDALAADEDRDGRQRTPAADPWVHQYLPGNGERPRELCAWGRRYTFHDNGETFRELRIPVLGSLERRQGDRTAKTAVEAFVLATGTPVDSDVLASEPGRYWGGVPFPMRHPDGRSPEAAPGPRRVRIVEVSCLDSAVSPPLFEGDVSEAKAFYAAEGRGRLRTVVRADARVPGSDCVSCKVHPGCTALPSVQGLLGVSSKRRPRRTWSVTTGRYYEDCPAKAHFRELRLPTEAGVEYPAPVRQGHAVHAWLQRLHERRPFRPCTADDLPEDPGSWSAGQWLLEGEDARRATEMLAGHIEVCPLKDVSPITDVRMEQTLAAEDPEADVVVLAKADMLFHRDGSLVYHELKTSGSITPFGSRRLMWRHPQLALAVHLFARGVIEPGPMSTVELETLTPSGPDVRTIDPRSESAQARAAEVVHGLTAHWYGEERFPPAPDPKVCGRCPYQRWCPSADPGEDPEER
ncbi:PD-(D/E)XK nuclease family protein [Nocardiopsis chromatogenes]|uniref:PD-(D/E)XK nuclease family protein n=1 Tax=Nocardiopsis chromatogenes TaxID=280239 RepID=UPI000A032362|nr:PD-(D/E)XK nuclease family protein [Nocardiopsis chromatogenes]